MVYVNSPHINFDDGTVIIDAAVCVLTDEKITCNAVAPWFQDFSEASIFLNVTDDELAFWKKSLPVTNERTRNDWKHDKQCQYVSGGVDTIPLSSKIDGQPVMCRCGMCKEMQGSEFEKVVDKSNPVYQHFFRAVISLLFDI